MHHQKSVIWCRFLWESNKSQKVCESNAIFEMFALDGDFCELKYVIQSIGSAGRWVPKVAPKTCIRGSGCARNIAPKVRNVTFWWRSKILKYNSLCYSIRTPRSKMITDDSARNVCKFLNDKYNISFLSTTIILNKLKTMVTFRTRLNKLNVCCISIKSQKSF